VTPPPVPAAVGLAGDIGTTVGLAAAAWALTVRLRRARDEERQQLRWIAVAATILATALAVLVGVGVARGTPAPWYLQAASTWATSPCLWPPASPCCAAGSTTST
jgi:hypothetical protein